MRLACAFVLVCACRDAGTIELAPSDALLACEPGTTVTATIVKNGECSTCDCAGGCPECATGGECIRRCEGGCDIGDPIELDPPSPGSYAAVLRYRTVNDAGVDVVTSVVCFKFDVDADGTESRTAVDDKTACCR
ncbi:MAG: hypothetical protein AB7T06_11090 [Kofleriaceae bacterium]